MGIHVTRKVFKLPYYHTSQYAQRMRRLSCKIFNDFYIPELRRDELDYSAYHPPVAQWSVKWFNDFRVYQRNQDKPLDVDSDRNHKYYPAHPQIRHLSHTLREYGLFRDEHRDFNEAMKLVALARGKVFRVKPSERKK